MGEGDGRGGQGAITAPPPPKNKKKKSIEFPSTVYAVHIYMQGLHFGRGEGTHPLGTTGIIHCSILQILKKKKTNTLNEHRTLM